MYTFSIALLFSLSVNGQSKSVLKVNSEYIHQFMSELHQQKTKAFISGNPEKVNEMKLFLEESVYFIQYKNIPQTVSQKLSNYKPLNIRFVQEEFEFSSFNPFLYGFEKMTQSEKIHIDGTKYVLFIKPRMR